MQRYGQGVACRNVRREQRGACGFIAAAVNTPGFPLTDLQRQNLQAARESFQRGDLTVTHYPLSVCLFLDYQCNLHCAHCYETPERRHKFWGGEAVDVDALAGEIREFARRGVTVDLVGGEPTVSPRFELVVELIREAGGAKLFLNTNGLTFHEKILPQRDILLGLNVSLDGCTRDGYESIRGAGTWERFFAQLTEIREAQVNVGFTMSVTAANMHEMPGVVELAAWAGARRLAFQQERGGGESGWIKPEKQAEFSLRKEGRAERLRGYLAAARERAAALGLPATFSFWEFE